MATQAEKAELFRSLHRQERPLVLPNAWDVPSARLFEDAGFPAVATSSAGLMVSHGYPDGEAMPKRELFAAIDRIAHVLTVPLSADVVAGYGRGAGGVAATVRKVIDAGAVGINLEDKDPTAERLFPVGAQVRKIRAIREAASAAQVPVVINARTDVLAFEGNPEKRLDEAIRRCQAFRDAGADCVYPMRLTDAASIETFVKAVQHPVNVMVRKGLPPLAELQRLGVKRVSFGPSASYATFGLLKRASAEILGPGTYETLTEGAISFHELNLLASPKPVEASLPPP
jgi:2-methylisocitrate lyase-like PEP mutase family enzyme